MTTHVSEQRAMRVLRHLATYAEPVKVSRLARDVCIDVSGVSVVVTRLIGAGLVARHDGGRCSRPVILTPLGRERAAGPVVARPRKQTVARTQPAKVPEVAGHMLKGAGDRDETCANYRACLNAAVAEWPQSDAHCKPGCGAFVPAARLRSTDYTASQRTAWGGA